MRRPDRTVKALHRDKYGVPRTARTELGYALERLKRLAELVRKRNAISKEIGEIIGRPALIGHVGEFIASEIFGVELEPSATNPGFDGRFREGPLAGRTVNVKWYAKKEGVLDIRPDALPDFYLVLAGPESQAVSSRGQARPWYVDAVFLFHAKALCDALRQRGLKIGVATSVRSELWRNAEVFPNRRCPDLLLNNQQREALTLFRVVPG